MKTIEYAHIEKSEWPRGPWDNEPDKMQYECDETGLACLIVRNPQGGNLCGYVGVPNGHPLHGVEYTDNEWDNAVALLECHGGVTFTRGCTKVGMENPERGICHIVEDGESDDVWWVGFDCAHGGDSCPGWEKHGSLFDGVYRDLDYVKSEILLLARQCKEISQ